MENLTDKSFQVIDRLGSSPDLKCIENCWSKLKGKLKDKEKQSTLKLIRELKILWTSHISREYFKKLSDSMHSRIQEVIVAKQETTKHYKC
jgi:hypothetical protein